MGRSGLRLRGRPSTVGIDCSGARHRVWCDGEELRLLDHPDDDGERVLEVLGGTPLAGCFAVRRNWREARVSLLPRTLAAMSKARWRTAGITAAAYPEFESALDVYFPHPEMRVGGVHPRLDAALWREVLGRRPTPEAIVELTSIGVDLSELAAWADGLQRPVTADAIAAARAVGVNDGYEASLWVEATGALPTREDINAWGEVRVSDPLVALAWTYLHGGAQVTPAIVRRYQEQGITDPERLLSPEDRREIALRRPDARALRPLAERVASIPASGR